MEETFFFSMEERYRMGEEAELYLRDFRALDPQLADRTPGQSERTRVGKRHETCRNIVTISVWHGTNWNVIYKATFGNYS